MNLGRFNGAIWALKIEIESNGILNLLDELSASLESSIAQPNTETADNFKKFLENLADILRKVSSNTASPSRRKIYHEIGAESKIGLGLLNHIEGILNKNTITPADALEDINNLTKSIKTYYGTVTTLADSFDDLQIEYDELDAEEYEIGITIPQNVLKGCLSNIEKELGCINEFLRVISEVATGKCEQIAVRTIGSSDLEVFLNTSVIIATCIAATIERLVALYKKQLEIKKLKLEIEQIKMPPKVTKPFDDHIIDIVQKELNIITKDLIKKFYKKKDPGRKNELTKHLSKVLEYIAERIDKGASVEVRVGQPVEPEKPDSDDNDVLLNYNKKLESYNKTLQENVVRLNQSGFLIGSLESRDEEILMLPEPYETDEGSDTERNID